MTSTTFWIVFAPSPMSTKVNYLLNQACIPFPLCAKVIYGNPLLRLVMMITNLVLTRDSYKALLQNIAAPSVIPLCSKTSKLQPGQQQIIPVPLTEPSLAPIFVWKRPLHLT